MRKHKRHKLKIETEELANDRLPKPLPSRNKRRRRFIPRTFRPGEIVQGQCLRCGWKGEAVVRTRRYAGMWIHKWAEGICPTHGEGKFIIQGRWSL